jgi:hypothetical protein
MVPALSIRHVSIEKLQELAINYGSQPEEEKS